LWGSDSTFTPFVDLYIFLVGYKTNPYRLTVTGVGGDEIYCGLEVFSCNGISYALNKPADANNFKRLVFSSEEYALTPLIVNDYNLKFTGTSTEIPSATTFTYEGSAAPIFTIETYTLQLLTLTITLIDTTSGSLFSLSSGSLEIEGCSLQPSSGTVSFSSPLLTQGGGKVVIK
jgi:hypothetical protein